MNGFIIWFLFEFKWMEYTIKTSDMDSSPGVKEYRLLLKH